MEYVRIEENSAEDESIEGGETLNTHSSFSPYGEPRDVSHCPIYTPYLPCHYFDYCRYPSDWLCVTDRMQEPGALGNHAVPPKSAFTSCGS